MKGINLFFVLLAWKKLRYAFISNFLKLYDRVEIQLYYKRIIVPLNNADSPSIFFVTDKHLPRTEKIAFAIYNLKKYNLILITKSDNRKVSREIYSAVYTVKSPVKTLWLVRKINPIIVHIFSSWNFDQAFSLIKKKKTFNAKIIFDDYDVFAGMLKEKNIKLFFPGQIRKEKYCLENTDAHCCRSLETQYAKKNLHYKINKHRIFFPEYMWKDTNEATETKKNVLVYIGNYNRGVIKLALFLQKIDWSLDIYSANFAKFSDIELPNNLIVHKPIPSVLLIDVIRSYPAAIQLPGCILDSNNTIYTPEKYKYAASGKIFDYLEAGLKVLISDELFQRWILKRYGAAIEIDENNSLEDIIRKLSNFEPRFFIGGKAKYNHLTLKNQVRRLDEFYCTLITAN
jgi:hypothetical protein